MDTTQRIRALMLPWLGHGHISPFLELAKKLTKRNFHIYLCSTPINLSSIRKRITNKNYPSIELVELHLPSLPDLPPHYHTTNGLPSHLMPALKTAFDMATESFSNILEAISPDLFIYDFNQPWAPDIASTYNIPAVLFLTTAPTVACFGFHTYRKLAVEFPFPAIQLQGFHDKQVRAAFEDTVNQNNEKQGSLYALEQSCKIVLFNTFRELEGKYIDYLADMAEKKVVPVGPLVQDIVDRDEDEEIIKWLDGKDEKSTVFVSFGSEYFPSKEEMEEVFHGLELSNVNFIWVIRYPVGEKIKVEEALPKVGKRGLVVEGWAPQAKILTHSSTGGFVSHCGWNSIMESLKFGVPIIAMPMHLDQPLNARLVEEVGVAVEVKRNQNGSLNREEIAQAIRKVVVEKTGEDIRRKARELSEVARMKGEEGTDEVVEELVQLCKDRKLTKH